jgi:hypothetical protein
LFDVAHFINNELSIRFAFMTIWVRSHSSKVQLRKEQSLIPLSGNRHWMNRQVWNEFVISEAFPKSQFWNVVSVSWQSFQSHREKLMCSSSAPSNKHSIKFPEKDWPGRGLPLKRNRRKSASPRLWKESSDMGTRSPWRVVTEMPLTTIIPSYVPLTVRSTSSTHRWLWFGIVLAA